MCLKHGGMNQSDSNFIDLEIQINPENINLNLKNSTPIRPNSQINNEGGFGIENVKKRLNSHYQNKHELTLESKLEQFKVELNLNLNHEQ